ncbi:MAG: zinc ribbon domain-containing protein [Spirochaetaceae bacterium]|jgi:putative FmdB family regulatory protein|nr:zinc ribbon domain-containing protein [Spirochaetaceae bacterium]
MPTYDYECDACHYRFEAFQSMTDEPLSSCPSCGALVRRVITGGAGVIYKGAGFYSSDRKESAGAGKESAEAGKEAKEGGATCPGKKDNPACGSCPAAAAS